MARVGSYVAVLLVTLVALAAAVLAFLPSDPTHGAPPCPIRPRTAKAAGAHFAPGLQEHINWLEFPVPEPDATAFTLCYDGRLFAVGIGQTPENGRVRASVATRWVDEQWLLGRLADAGDSRHWELGYTTYTLGGG